VIALSVLGLAGVAMIVVAVLVDWLGYPRNEDRRWR
jgi:hypothetical protein